MKYEIWLTWADKTRKPSRALNGDSVYFSEAEKNTRVKQFKVVKAHQENYGHEMWFTWKVKEVK